MKLSLTPRFSEVLRAQLPVNRFSGFSRRSAKTAEVVCLCRVIGLAPR
jgi:hypothetical protein